MRKQVLRRLSPWDQSHDEGERVVDYDGEVYDLRESHGRNKRSSGELTPVRPSAAKHSKAVCIEGIWYWERRA